MGPLVNTKEVNMAKHKPIKTWEEFTAASKRLRAKQVFVDSRLETFQV